MAPEQTASVGDIEIAYETFGDPGDPAMLLVMGLGVQMLGWDEEFCELLVGRGFFVVRFDNRDVGRSTKIRSGPAANVLAAASGDLSSASYLLADMADDAVGLLDVLGVERAHVVGSSQGGMIAQTIAIRHPDRVLSLASIMSSTGNREVGQPHPEAITALLDRPPTDDREGFASFAERAFRTIGSTAYPENLERIKERARLSFDRGVFPEGTGRQLVAILASGDRTEQLRKLDVPTVVIHGVQDPLIDVSGGRATAEAIPGAKLELIDDMGHDMPEELWPRLVELIVENAQRAQPSERTATLD